MPVGATISAIFTELKKSFAPKQYLLWLLCTLAVLGILLALHLGTRLLTICIAFIPLVIGIWLHPVFDKKKSRKAAKHGNWVWFTAKLLLTLLWIGTTVFFWSAPRKEVQRDIADAKRLKDSGTLIGAYKILTNTLRKTVEGGFIKETVECHCYIAALFLAALFLVSCFWSGLKNQNRSWFGTIA